MSVVIVIFRLLGQNRACVLLACRIGHFGISLGLDRSFICKRFFLISGPQIVRFIGKLCSYVKRSLLANYIVAEGNNYFGGVGIIERVNGLTDVSAIYLHPIKALEYLLCRNGIGNTDIR